MNRKNRQFIYLFLTGWVGVITGAGLKLVGNPNYHIALGAALLLEIIAVSFLIYINFSRIKTLFKSKK